MNSLLAFISGIMIGAAQISTRYLIISSNKSTLMIFIILILYLFSALIWITLLKSSNDIAMVYGILILGSFTSLLAGNYLLDSRNSFVEIKDIFAIILISIGCYLLK